MQEVDESKGLPDVGEGRDGIEVEHELYDNTEVLVEGMVVCRRLIWMREEVCEKDDFWIKREQC